jgi:DNA-nicking Smr family endonuclease
MSKKDEISIEEQTLFRNAMRDVKPIAVPTTIAPQPKRYPLRKKPRLVPEEPAYAPYSDFDKEQPVSGQDMLEFSRSGLQDKTLRKMRRGQYNVEAKLDLHGMTAAGAKEALFRFLQQCRQHEVRHVLIIHGKGRDILKPVLKNKLNNWLRQLDQILAFCSATAKDGQSGAMYVLLKNEKREKAF